MTIAWVIGSGGLLGSALVRILHHSGTVTFRPDKPFHWNNERKLIVQLEVAVRKFAAIAREEKEWQIYWAAGIGTMGSTESELAIETRTLSTLIGLIESEPDLYAAKGCIAFASSAGAIYAGAKDDVISEYTPVAPTTIYASEKLKQEDLVGALALNNTNLSVLLARISTLYGPGQASGKQQGLLAQIARCILRNEPIHIYVPFDTIRDYITADDAAASIFASISEIREKSGVFIKIIASEKPATIAEIVSTFKRVTRRTPRIVVSLSKLSSIYARRIQFRSIAVPLKERVSRTSLLVGIAQVMAAERSAYTRSRR